MGSETIVPRIPIVELSGEKLKAGSDSWNSGCQEVRKALEEYGVFELVFNKCSIDFHNSIFEAVEELFKLPRDIKTKSNSPKPGFGYYGQNTIFPIHEAIGIENANNKQECQNFTQDMWPHGNQHFCETVHSYAKLVAELQELVVKMICESYDIEKEYSESHMKSATYLLRLMSYRRRDPSTDSIVGFISHTDKGFLSILHQNHVKGLQIRAKDGDDHWISYNPSSHSSFVVFVGDAFMAWSNDRMKPCYHRVKMEDEGVRYTVGLFSFMKGWIKAPKELIDEEHPFKYKPFEHQAFLDFYLSSNDPNKHDSNILKAFSGI